MADVREDQRLALANLHALSLATLRGKDAPAVREYLDALTDYAPETRPLDDTDPRSDASLGCGLADAGAARRLAARLRGVVLGAAAHGDRARSELGAMARSVVAGEAVEEALLERRARAAFEETRADLLRDVVRLGAAPLLDDEGRGGDGARARRWGGVRALELNAFVAVFTREGVHPEATRATRTGRDAGALRYALAAAQAGMSLAQGSGPDAWLEDELRRVEAALPALLANLTAAARVG